MKLFSFKRKPKYKHDCNRCVFLGHYKKADLYYCDQDGIETLIARFSDDLPDYYSGMMFAKRNPFLKEALKRATKRKLIKYITFK